MKKIYIGGSMYFAKEMIETQEYFKKRNYQVFIPVDAQECLNNPSLSMNDEHCDKFDVMRDSMEKLAQSDVFLVLNYSKNGEDGYIGGSVLIELGLAYFLKKKTYLLFPPPIKERVRYTQEILHMKPIILNGDLEKITY
ncbi:MAG: hypothetical protein MUF50_03655 [Planctomycetes bacterium]|jgi:hypothetical protein|nr:hypothetical protein [Planctomycetota bacterium]